MSPAQFCRRAGAADQQVKQDISSRLKPSGVGGAVGPTNARVGILDRQLQRLQKAPQARRCSLAESPATYRKQVFTLFLSRLYLVKVAELERPRRHPKAFGTPFHLLSGTPSSVPRHRSDGWRARRSAFKCVTTV